MAKKKFGKLKVTVFRLCSAFLVLTLVFGLCGTFGTEVEAASGMTGSAGPVIPEVKTTIRNITAAEKNIYSLLFGNGNEFRVDGKHNSTTDPDTFEDVDGSLDQSMPVLLKTLDANGYPQLKTNDRGYDITKMNSLYGTNSLEPIFNNTSGSGSQTYTSTNTLFTYNSATERYTFDSSKNHVYFDTSTKSFTVYNEPLRPYDITTSYGYDTFGAFLPFNSTKNVIQITDANGKKVSGVTYGGEGGVSWNESASHAANMYVTPHVGENQADDWFVMSIEFTFFIPEDGKINGKDMVFNFSGDDDVWVYVDDVLVVDQGGTHKHTQSSINFASGEVKYQKYDKNADTTGLDTEEAAEVRWPWVTTNIKSCFAEAASETGNSSYTEASKFNGNTFSDYSVHTLTFFFMERGGEASNCKLDFNLPIIPSGALTVHKETDGYMTEDADREYTFVLNDADGEAISGVTYSVVSGTGNVTSGKTTDANGQFKLKANESAVFDDIEGGVDYSIVQLEEIGNATYTTYVNTTSCTIDGTATNDSDSSAGFNTGNFEVNYKDKCVVTFTNHLKQDKELTVTKAIGDYVSADQEFSFVAKIEGKTDESFTLKGGEVVTLTDIPVGAKVVITETVPEGMEASSKLSTDSDYTSNNVYTVTALTENSTVNFLNEIQLLELTVEKLIDGSLGNKAKQFDFTVDIEYGDYSDDVVKTHTFKLSDKGTKTISNIPYGAKISISEDAQDYTATVTVGSTSEENDSYDITKLTADTTVTFENVKDGSPNTGVSLDSIPYIIILALTLAGAAAFVIRRRRVENEQ